MSRRWFSRSALELDSEKLDITVRTLQDAKINTKRILTTEDTQYYVIENLTMSLNNGATISSMTIEGVPTAPNAFHVHQSSAGKIGFIYIPAFSITALGGATPPTQITISGATFPLQPLVTTAQGTIMINNGDDLGFRMWIDLSNNVNIKGFRIGADTNFVVPFGFPYAISFSFEI